MFTGILYFLAGTLLGLVGLAGIVVLVLYICGHVGVDGLFAFGAPRARLTCWHCGEQTRTGRRHCEHCGEELQ